MTLPGFPPASGPGGSEVTPVHPAGSGEASDWVPRHDPPTTGTPDPAAADAPTTDRRWSRPERRTRPPGASPAKMTVTRVAAARTAQLTRNTVQRIDRASRRDGADESGLRTLLWSNTVSMAGDAVIAVWLAATLFFAAPGEQQRGNVALYLLVTVAPFAVLAPIFGPLLDRLDHGRRWALAATMVGRGLMCWLLAAYDSKVVLYVCALLCLVLSRSYLVLKGAVVPRVIPDKVTLVIANSRMNIFGLVGAGVVGAAAAGVIKIPFLGPTGALILGLLVFLGGAVVSLKLPKHVDTDAGEEKVTFTRAGGTTTKGQRTRLSLGTAVVTALRSTAAQKFLGGFLSFFLIFYIQAAFIQRAEGSNLTGLAWLGALGAVAALGSVVGTSLGSRTGDTNPDTLVLISTAVAVAFCVIAAVTPSLGMSIVVALVAAVASAIGKASLDAIVQREVPERFRSSAFSRSETVLQLAWVIGGTIGILLPTDRDLLWVGFTVAAVVLVVAFGLTLMGRHRAQQSGPQAAGVSLRAPRTGQRLRVRRPRPDAPAAPTPPSAVVQAARRDWRATPTPHPGANQPTTPLPDFAPRDLRGG